MEVLFGQPLMWYHPNRHDISNLPDTYYELGSSPYCQLPTELKECVKKFVMSDQWLRPMLGWLLLDPAVANFLGWPG